jgi:FMN-dependent NADH-azoreductase
MVFSEIKEFAAENPQLQVVAREVKKNVHPHLHGVFGMSMRRSARARSRPPPRSRLARARAHSQRLRAGDSAA